MGRKFEVLSLVLVIIIVSCFSSVGFTLSLGNNITIYDNRSGTYNRSDGDGWWTNTNEDQEVEPGMVYTQPWDLEGFFLNGTTLTVVGGFDFKNGYTYNNKTYHSGDIFIDTTGDAKFGDDSVPGDNNYGYEYALDLDFDSLKFDVYKLSSSSVLTPVSESYNIEESNPWRYRSGGNGISGWTDKTFSFYSGLSNSDVGGLLGGTHYAFSVDLGFLGDDIDNFIAHFTIECGNDNLIGAVPEPSTILLVGLGLLGLGVGVRERITSWL